MPKIFQWIFLVTLIAFLSACSQRTIVTELTGSATPAPVVKLADTPTRNPYAHPPLNRLNRPQRPHLARPLLPALRPAQQLPSPQRRPPPPPPIPTPG
ncbi:MAG: hypothetical protein HS126_14690 [Anaerolineales bacterium]|nr:hypothetical protein [Anaerolineales bacterium]